MRDMKEERRLAHRWNVFTDVAYETSDSRQKQALASDISNKGIKLFLCDDCDINKEVSLKIDLKHFGDAVAKAQACWKKTHPNGFYIGLKFTQVTEFERVKIFEYVKHYHPDQVKKTWFNAQISTDRKLAD